MSPHKTIRWLEEGHGGIHLARLVEDGQGPFSSAVAGQADFYSASETSINVRRPPACTPPRRATWLLYAQRRSTFAPTETFLGGCFHEERQTFAKELRETTFHSPFFLPPSPPPKSVEDASSREKHVQRPEATLLLHLPHCHGDPELPGEDAAPQ